MAAATARVQSLTAHACVCTFTELSNFGAKSIRIFSKQCQLTVGISSENESRYKYYHNGFCCGRDGGEGVAIESANVSSLNQKVTGSDSDHGRIERQVSIEPELCASLDTLSHRSRIVTASVMVVHGITTPIHRRGSDENANSTLLLKKRRGRICLSSRVTWLAQRDGPFLRNILQPYLFGWHKLNFLCKHYASTM
ncbi:hypothetical protein EVAR_14464_1 [Eumeta japonica]|uniref:Uncharacterized protein n=1 Tax=Eumeta variegata TaxID=151549 RepID=A0A4C1U388_EUMVA|nr:hypothetical protein EVAR_14464_1 [Eumeta japonica]